ncbi:MAG: hypothetical protein OXG11_01640 [Chloroflexi bacterium]|nr:hypothetical protein [Chloroflexota bacterium]
MRLKWLSGLCWLCAVVMFFFYYYFPFNVDFVQTLWDYAIDPVILATFILIVIVNVSMSLQAHNAGMGLQRLPMDIFTMAVGFTGALYMHNYVLKFAGSFEPSAVLWDVLAAAVIVIMPVSGISYWRLSKRS